MTEYLYFP